MSSSYLRTALIPKRPIGAFRGSLLGFLAGIATVSAAGYYTLFDKYMSAARLLQQSVDDIKTSSLALRAYSARLDALEERCTDFTANLATKAALEAAKTDAKGLYNDASLTALDIKRAVWSLEEDMRTLMHNRRTTVSV